MPGRASYTDGVRIVALHPAATEIVHLLGLDNSLVGVSADSDWPPELVQRVPLLNTIAMDTRAMSSREIDAAAAAGHQGASLYHVDAERLRSVRPELILTQEVCEVCAVSRRDVDLATQTLGYSPIVMSLNPVTLEQMLEDVETVARAAGVPQQGRALVRDRRARVEAVSARTAGLHRPRVFCMEWLDPPYSAGHWVPEMVNLAGGREDIGTPGGFSREIEWSEVIDYQPDVIVLIPCSLGLDQIATEFPSLRTRLSWAQIPAARAGRVYAADTHLFSCSGPRLVEGVEVLARLIHPEVIGNRLCEVQALKVSDDGTRLERYR
jgi:iron complex transport system substrate-binding protein